MTVEIILKKEKTTLRKQRYVASDDIQLIDTIYCRQDELKAHFGKIPETLKLTLEVVPEPRK